jgi:hypothetical protein
MGAVLLAHDVQTARSRMPSLPATWVALTMKSEHANVTPVKWEE